MNYLVKIYQGELNVNGHKYFEWLNEDYTKLKAVFCSPGTNLSLAFNDGKNLILRGLEYNQSEHTSPNKRAFFVDKQLCREVLKGVVSKADATIKNKVSIYLILEK